MMLTHAPSNQLVILSAEVQNEYKLMVVHTNHHAGAAPAQIGMKTEAAKFPVFCYNSLERGTLQSTIGGVVRNSPVAKAVYKSV